MAKPFAIIERRAVRGEPVRVLVNGEPVGEFKTIREADAFANELNEQRKAIERDLKDADPARYWKLRAEALQALLTETEGKLAKRSSEVLSQFFRSEISRNHKKRAARQPRPGGRVLLKESIQRIMRAEKNADTKFKTFMSRWQREPIESLRCTPIDEKSYLIEDENDIEDRARVLTWGTLQNYYSQS